MKQRRTFSVLLCTSMALLVVHEAMAGGTELTSVRVASGLSSPVFLTAPPGDMNRLFIVEQGGRIKILTGGSILPTPYLNISAIISSGGERGLLSMAFHPNYASNGFFFVNYTNTAGSTVIARYTVSGDPNVANSGSALILKTISQPFSNHNGGQLQFGPDGKLYVGMGDGGSGNDPNGNGQNTGTLLGKMLRLDVDAGAPYIPADNPFVGAGNPLDEIWAIGVRNPWRFSFDRLTGDMYIADVGQNAREEIDFQPASSTGGENYGWRCMEGFACTGLTGCTCNSPSLVLPILDYTHALGCSISGGYVYRGNAIPDLRGTYFYSDYCTSFIRTFRYVGGAVTDQQVRTTELTPNVGSFGSIVSFGEDAAGELYIVDLDGEIFKIISTLVDCNLNGIDDAIDIANGTSQDCNNDQIPDECELANNDCNNDQIPDECQLAGNDCNANGTPDECETDCNANGSPDDCDISSGTSADCDGNGIPDDCQVDCNTNGIADPCDVSSGTSTDCDGNGVPDECQGDCDGDGTPDVCETGIPVFFDNFENDLGWTVASQAPIGGAWERAAPQQTLLSGFVAQPGEDYPGGTGTLCYVTDAVGPITSQHDVDNGPTRVTSPTIDLTAGTATLTYAYWLFTSGGVTDSLSLEVSNDDGQSWVPVLAHTVSASAWRTQRVVIDDYVARTTTMRLRFSIGDPGNDSTTEGLIDDVLITVPDCPSVCTTPALVWAHSVATHKIGGGMTDEFFVNLDITDNPAARTSEPRDSGIAALEFQFDRDVLAAGIAIQGNGGPAGGGPLTLGPGDNGSMSLGRIDLGSALPNQGVYTITVSATTGPTCDLTHELCAVALVGDFTNDGAVAANDKAEQLGFAFQPIAQGNAKYDLQTNGGDSGTIEVADIAAWTGFFGTSVTTAPCPTP